MTKRRILTVTLLTAAVGVVSWLILSQPGEPVYQGKPLSYWCDHCAANPFLSSDQELQKQAVIAIQTIGTNAVPTLLRMLKAKDSEFKLKLIQLTQKQHLINIKWRMAETRRLEAVCGFYCLGPQGKSALPALLELCHEHRPDLIYDPNSVAEIIGFIGPAAADAVPLVVQDTTDTNSFVRWNAVEALGEIHSRPDLAVPALTVSLRDPDGGIREAAAQGLGTFGSDAKAVIPELIKALSDPSPDVRDAAAAALQKIDPDAAAKAGVK